MSRFVLLFWLLALGSCGNNLAAGSEDGGATSESGVATPGEEEGGSPNQGRGGDGGSGSAGDADAGSTSTADDGSVSSSAPDDGGGDGPYGSNGPSTVTTTTFQVPSPTAPSGTFTTTAYVPSAQGPYPVVILSSGFFQPGAAYAPYAERLASWGILTFLRDDPNLGETTPNLVSDVEYTVTTWLASTNTTSSSALFGKIDPSKVALAGHSRGGQVALLAGEGLTGKIKGVFGLDPVDTSTSPDPEARTALATIGVPVAFIGETTDSASSGCAPAADDFLVLYQAAASPAVAITVPNADHTMFEAPASCSFCTLCTAGTASQPAVLAAAVRYLTAFFARQLLGDASVGAAFQGAGANVDVASGFIQIQSK